MQSGTIICNSTFLTIGIYMFVFKRVRTWQLTLINLKSLASLRLETLFFRAQTLALNGALVRRFLTNFRFSLSAKILTALLKLAVGHLLVIFQVLLDYELPEGDVFV